MSRETSNLCKQLMEDEAWESARVPADTNTTIIQYAFSTPMMFLGMKSLCTYVCLGLSRPLRRLTVLGLRATILDMKGHAPIEFAQAIIADILLRESSRELKDYSLTKFFIFCLCLLHSSLMRNVELFPRYRTKKWITLIHTKKFMGYIYLAISIFIRSA